MKHLQHHFLILGLFLILVSCGKAKQDNKEQPKDTTTVINNIQEVQDEDKYARYDSLNEKAIEKTEYLTLISGYSGPDGATIYFMTEKGDSLFTRRIPDHIKWKEKDESFSEIEPRFLNKKYRVTYKMQWEPYDPSGGWEERMNISSMK